MLYVARHGQTTWNAQNKLCGQVDVPLTDLGREQARQLGRRLADEGVRFDRIIASPLSRAYGTAEIAARELGFPEESIETDARLLEMAFGEHEGVQIGSKEHLEYWGQFGIRFPGGESTLDVASRAYPLIRELQARAREREAANLPEENALLVCHGAMARVINSYFEDLPNDRFFKWALANATANSYEL